MIGQVGQIIVGLVDNIMVGKLGAAPLAAVSLGNAIFTIALALAIGFSMGITPLVAETDGNKNTIIRQRVFKNGIWLCLIVGILLLGLIKLIQPLIFIFEQPKEVVSLAIPYLNIITISIIPFAVFMGFKQFTDGMSATRYAMAATIIGNIINIILNYVLIYGKFGFPKLELEGAAIGTLLSRVIMAILMIAILKSKKQFSLYFKGFFNTTFDKVTFFKLLVIGFPVAMQMLFEFGFFASSIFLSGNLGTEAQAANQIALNLASMAFMVAVGLGVTATIRTGNQLGKKNFKELVRIVKSILLLTLVLELILGLLFISTNTLLPLLYINNPKVILIASQLLIIVAWFQLSDGLQITLLGTLRGLQDVNIPMIISFIAYWCIGFPIAYWYGSVSYYGTFGIWLGLFSGIMASSILLFLRYKYLTRSMH